MRGLSAAEYLVLARAKPVGAPYDYARAKPLEPELYLALDGLFLRGCIVMEMIGPAAGITRRTALGDLALWCQAALDASNSENGR